MILLDDHGEIRWFDIYDDPPYRCDYHLISLNIEFH